MDSWNKTCAINVQGSLMTEPFIVLFWSFCQNCASFTPFDGAVIAYVFTERSWLPQHSSETGVGWRKGEGWKRWITYPSTSWLPFHQFTFGLTCDIEKAIIKPYFNKEYIEHCNSN